MAPFKLKKFRMGGNSRSTSQENDEQQQGQTQQTNLVIATMERPGKITTSTTTNSSHFLDFGSNTTLDSDQTSENSLLSMNNDQRALLLNHKSSSGLGNTHSSGGGGINSDEIGYTNPSCPLSPPPTYDFVMEEKRLLALDKENNPTTTTTIHTNILLENFFTSNLANNNNLVGEIDDFTNMSQINGSDTSNENNNINNNQCTSSSSQENLMMDSLTTCSGSCDQLLRGSCENVDGEHAQYLDNEQYNQHCHENDLSEQCSLQSTGEQNEAYDNYANEYSNECASQYHNEYQTEYQTDEYDQQQQHHQYTPESKGPEILYKSSKELYKAVARECGITCKMSDNCKCLDCQSRYFDCEYDQNEHEKTDGGLGAGTPMYISEVMNGTACTIL